MIRKRLLKLALNSLPGTEAKAILLLSGADSLAGATRKQADIITVLACERMRIEGIKENLRIVVMTLVYRAHGAHDYLMILTRNSYLLNGFPEPLTAYHPQEDWEKMRNKYTGREEKGE
jgi:hypothetical protein